MTTAEAIKGLQVLAKDFSGYRPNVEMFDMAISALREAESKQNVSYGDLISRKSAIESIRECAECADANYEWDMRQGYLNAIECLEEEPPAVVEIVTCENCKHCDFGIDEDDRPFFKCLHGRSYGGTRPNDYCSWGEKR